MILLIKFAAEDLNDVANPMYKDEQSYGVPYHVLEPVAKQYINNFDHLSQG